MVKNKNYKKYMIMALFTVVILALVLVMLRSKSSIFNRAENDSSESATLTADKKDVTKQEKEASLKSLLAKEDADFVDYLIGAQLAIEYKDKQTAQGLIKKAEQSKDKLSAEEKASIQDIKKQAEKI
ncbi:hypothetical protein KA529_03885 [Candidatus Saccharibacteria bacterium]|nr:hypothetical protein [Candidatus Saccharibacteria bacterium]